MLSCRGRGAEGQEVGKAQDCPWRPSERVVGRAERDEVRVEKLVGPGHDLAGWLCLKCCGEHSSHHSTGFRGLYLDPTLDLHLGSAWASYWGGNWSISGLDLRNGFPSRA